MRYLLRPLEQKVIVEVLNGVCSYVHLPVGFSSVLVDHAHLDADETSDGEVFALMEATPELPWGAQGYDYQGMMVRTPKPERTVAPLPSGKVIVEMAGGNCQACWTPAAVGYELVDHDNLADPETSEESVAQLVAATAELPWGSDGFDYREAMFNRPNLALDRSPRGRRSGLAG